MNEQDYQKIYESAKENSIGPEKKAPASRKKQKLYINITIGVLVAGLATAGIVSIFAPKNDEKTITPEQTITETVEYESEYNGYSDIEIGTYERLRAKDLLDDYGFTDYTEEGNKRNYNYTSEDYKKITELDESYLYALYIITTENTFNEFLKALGYENLQSFLITNNYTDENNKPSLYAWALADLEEISLIMKDKTEEKVQGK